MTPATTLLKIINTRVANVQPIWVENLREEFLPQIYAMERRSAFIRVNPRLKYFQESIHRSYHNLKFNNAHK
jgi:hypothetical protein